MKILLAEDDRYLNKLLAMRLAKWGYEVEQVSNGKDALKKLQAENGPRMAILDWMMPEMDGITVTRQMRQSSSSYYIYILLLTARDQMDDFLEGMEAGADDFMTKPFKDQELQARLRAGRRILELQDSLIAAREALQYQANHDQLTGKWTRAAIFEILDKEMDRAKRDGSTFSVLMVDIDYFKQINDRYGHRVGDEVLREAASRMQNAIRSYDSIGRYGGEEFLIILPNCSPDNSRKLAERLRTELHQAPIRIDNIEISITCSAGSVSWQKDNCNSTCVDLIDHADISLYKAKQQGRNQVVVFDQEFVEIVE